MRLARIAITSPRQARIPVLLPMSRWIPDDLVESIYETLNSYSKVSKETVNRLLDRGRILLLADGVDQCPNYLEFGSKLVQFRQRFPSVQVIVSSRPNRSFSIDGLPEIPIDPLSENEIKEFLEASREDRNPVE